MLRTGFILLTLHLILLFISGCQSKPDVVNIQASWKSTDPAGIPLQIRLTEIGKRNLVINPSFENGKYFKIDSLNTSFNLRGWKKVGKNVFWTDIQNDKEYQANEALHGLHSIKIVRENSDETDNQGEGIISDFIKVIPGNYKLSFYIRLERVESNISRLSAGLYDAINIRVFYYNKGKLLIKSNEFNPATNNYIDNSFKGFSFSNINYLEALDWVKVQGKSAHFPFDEGDIPNDARYIKIFLGLKGNGIMWVDLIDFEYSDENISLMESCEPLFDSIMPAHSYLIPKPKELYDYSAERLVASVNDMSLQPLILIPANADDDIQAAGRKIALTIGDALKEPGKKIIPAGVISRIDERSVESGRLIISIGKTSLFNEYAGTLPFSKKPLSPGMYTITQHPAMKRLVFVDAADTEGYIHAVNTINQLIDKTQKTYHHYNIFDYPDISIRGVILPVTGEMMRSQIISLAHSLVEAGYNLLYFQDGDDRMSPGNMDNLAARYLDIKSTLQKSPLSNCDFGLSLLNMNISMTDEPGRDMEKLKVQSENFGNLLNKYSDDFRNFLITDNSIWDYMNMGPKAAVYKQVDPDVFVSFLKSRNIFISGILNKYKKLQPNKILFLPVFSTNENITYSDWYSSLYFGELNRYKSSFGGLLWKGPVDYPARLDYVETLQFRKKSLMQNYMFINNLTTHKQNKLAGSYFALYPGEARLGNIFEPLSIDMAEAPGEMGMPDFCVVNQNQISSISRIRLLTAADYQWNMKEYNPSLSVWNALLRVYGRDNAILLIRFNDTFYRLMHQYVLSEKEKMNPKNARECEDLIISLNIQWSEIKRNLNYDISLLNDLSDLRNHVIGRIYRTENP